MKKKLCVIDHYFHQKTKSLQFLIDILNRDYDLDIYWDYAPMGGSHVSLDIINKYEAVFFFQVLNPIAELKRIKGKIIWMPMYDGLETNDAWWYRLSAVPMKIVCFCKRVYNQAVKIGFDAIYLQYYKNPSDFLRVTDFSSRRVFFWQRGDIPFSLITRLLGENKIDSVDLKMLPDPGYKNPVPDKQTIQKYNITTHNEFLSREDFISILNRNNIFISPRRQEGIGMIFLEALAMGQCLIGHNDATMDEYIEDNHTGYLFDAKNIRQLDLSGFGDIAAQSAMSGIAGWKKWADQSSILLDFIEGPPSMGSRSNRRGFFKYASRFFLNDAVYTLKDSLKRITR